MKKIFIALLVIACGADADTKVRDAQTQGASINVLDKGAPCDGVNDDQPAFARALTALPSTGGVIDARGCTAGVKLTTALVVNKAGATILWPAANISLGTNTLTVPVGVHNVSFVGPTSYGSPSTSTVLGCFFAYTGTGVAVSVGDATADTNNFRLEGCTININAAGSAAIGLQLNRAVFYHLVRPRVTGLLAANTQKLIDLEGATNFTGGQMDAPRLDNGNVGIYLGKNANANTIIQPVIALQLTGTGIAFTGDVTGPLNGNTVVGGDIENCTTAITFDFASDNTVWGLRAEACTNAVTATANSLQNLVFSNGQTHLMAISDLGTNNAFTDTYYAQFSRTTWKLRNATDAATDLILDGGAAVNQFVALNFRDRGTTKYIVRKNNDNTFSILNQATALNRLVFAAANTTIDSEGGGAVKLNTSTGTGGTQFGNGAGGVSATIDSAGRVAPGAFTNATLGAPANGVVVYCSDCTIANPCAGAGTGAIAKRLNGVWVCN